jgi:hypothetical protein
MSKNKGASMELFCKTHKIMLVLSLEWGGDLEMASILTKIYVILSTIRLNSIRNNLLTQIRM